MKFFIDTANIDQIKEAAELGILDGVTTNPSLMAKEGITGTDNIYKHYKAICAPNIVVKVPMTKDGIKAIHWLTSHNIRTNCTLVFSAGQAILAAKAGATYLSPFIGRVDDINWDGMALIQDIADIYAIQGYDTAILAASIRTSKQIVDAAKAGADVVTCPLSAILGLLKHPLTDIGLAQFLADHKKAEEGSEK